ncbi:MAG: cellulase family glycosylhydrolase [Planctomycetota bacterium]|nr:cellulase family glycosylhydrolase [Planctomycetota bacterium]
MLNVYRLLNCIVLMSVCLPLCTIASEPPQKMQGLTVHKGRLLRGGNPYRGIGANYFSLFSRTIADPSDTSSRRQLERLSRANIPFVRFMACGFWPVDWDLYLTDKDEYFRRLDDIVKCAEDNEIGLIPSLFWNIAHVPDIVGEHVDQLGNPQSKTCELIRRYTSEVVLRYRSSPAIWGWEFANECNLHVDLPNASSHRPVVHPKLKTAAKRTRRDEMSSKMMLAVFNEFARTVREHDKHRILITGNSRPRPSAWHNTKEKSWRRDTREQYAEILLRDNPDPFDTLCVHIYPKKNNDYPVAAKSLDELVKTIRDVSSRSNKPLFIGEFSSHQAPTPRQQREEFEKLVAAIETNKVPLSAFWVFDYPPQQSTCNITFENNRSYMLEIVAEANRRMNREGD